MLPLSTCPNFNPQMTAENLQVSEKAYFKLIFHAAKYPKEPVCGILLGRNGSISETV
jgi:Uncharacterised protein family (UPF0172)